MMMATNDARPAPATPHGRRADPAEHQGRREHDIDDDANIVKISDARFTIKGITPIEDFNLEAGAGFSDDEFDTVGGLVTNEFGRVPKRGCGSDYCQE